MKYAFLAALLLGPTGTLHAADRSSVDRCPIKPYVLREVPKMDPFLTTDSKFR
jgi:hypothetical protein